MKPPTETVRVGKQAKDQLIKLKRQTGIENWNILCRWALAASLREAISPPPFHQKLEGGIEMTWKIFAGDLSEIFILLIRHRMRADGFRDTEEDASACFRAHLHRGLAYLSSGKETKSLSYLVQRSFFLHKSESN